MWNIDEGQLGFDIWPRSVILQALFSSPKARVTGVQREAGQSRVKGGRSTLFNVDSASEKGLRYEQSRDVEKQLAWMKCTFPPHFGQSLISPESLKTLTVQNSQDYRVIPEMTLYTLYLSKLWQISVKENIAC